MVNYINENRIKYFVVLMALIFSVASLLPACREDKISGTVSAPGGVIDCKNNKCEDIARANSMAPVPHTRVKLVRIDDSGNEIDILGITNADSTGKYTLKVPVNFKPSANYLVVAGSKITLSAFVTGTTVDINPYTQTTVALITGVISAAGSTLSKVSYSYVAAVQEIVVQNIGNVPMNLTATQLVIALKAVIQNNVDSNNIISSILGSGTITGLVTDSNDTPLPGIKIMVRTFGNQVTQAFVRTDTSGNYTISVPAGDYVVCAINDTTQSYAASQWWTSSGGSIGMRGAGKITVDSSTPIAVNFKLDNGGRISGTVTGGSSNTLLDGIVVTLRDFDSQITLVWAITSPDGTYSLNVSPGDYTISFRNGTISQPYASGDFNSAIPGGSINTYQAEKITVTVGGSIPASINLTDGGLIQGKVSDAPENGNVVAGISVKVNDYTGAFAHSLSTGADGTYNLWLQPNLNPYIIYSRGQMAYVVVSLGSTVTQDFSATMSEITTSIKDASGNPVSMAFVDLFSTKSETNYQFLGWEVTNGDGSVVQYAIPGSSVYLVISVNNGQMVGSQDYNGKLNYPVSGNQIAVPSDGSRVDLGTISLPAGAILTGKVMSASTGLPVANSYVQIRYGGYSPDYRFVTVHTMVDGSYTISLPANTIITCLCAFPWNWTVGGPSAYTLYVAIGAAGTITVAPTLSY